MSDPSSLDWKAVAAKKREDILSSSPIEWRLPMDVIEKARSSERLVGPVIESLLDTETKKITRLDCKDILHKVAKGDLSAVQVMRSFCKRTAFAHQLNANAVEICFDTALAEAESLDSHCAQHQTTVGPLHGLPISLKDQFHVPGYDTSMGYVGWIGTQGGIGGPGTPKSLESELVQELRSLGAIIIAKTSPAQTLWCGETNNNIVGYNYNPCKQILSSGGSSGGQAALVALRGTPIGFGTDIGGSVTVPAAFNRLFGIKPSHGRISFKDAVNSSPGQPIIHSVVGITSHSLEDIRMMFEALLTAEPWTHDSNMLPIGWRRERAECIQHTSPLCFGVMMDDGVVVPHPPILRALRMVKAALESQGHSIIPWDPPSHRRAGLLHDSVTSADGGVDVAERIKLSGEPIIPEIREFFENGPEPQISISELYELSLKVQEYRDEYQAYWKSRSARTPSGCEVDAVILPVATSAALVPGKFYHYDYGTIANTLNYTSMVIPVTTADASIDVFPEDYQPRNDTERKNCEAYDADKYDGAPAAIQLMCRSLEEEKLLAVADLVVAALGANQDGARLNKIGVY